MKRLTVDDIQQAIYDIRKISYDDEAAHAKEDELYTLVLEEIANGNSDAVNLAKEALESKFIDFTRYYS